MKCPECGEALSVTHETYHASEAFGLSHVILNNVEFRRCKNCGEEDISIPKMTQLHKLIATSLVRKSGTLTGEEVRFLRKYLGWSQEDFAHHAGVVRETVSRWENEHESFSGTADRFLRLAVVQWGPIEHYEQHELDAANEPNKKPLHIDAAQKSHGWELTSVS